jgi:membrane-bound lytic murein transglycosylase A
VIPGRVRAFLAALSVTGLVACAPEKPQPPAPSGLVLEESGFDALPGWRDDALAEALPPFLKSCDRLTRQPAERAVGPGGLGGTVADWQGPCAAAASMPAGDADAARAFFAQWFVPFAVLRADVDDGDAAEGLFTGYYEVELDGARAPDATYAAPLYRRPADLVTVDLGDFRADWEGDSIIGRVVDGRLKPYFDRAAIDGGALAGQQAELLWVRDPVDSFFLQIQGSGRVRLAEGGTVRVGFAASNGLKFRGIARDLIDMGVLPKDDASMQAVRDWLRANPAEAAALMQKNPRYIFFREIDGPDALAAGPVGAQGATLTPLRSLAVDTSLLPLGAPLWLDTTWPPGTARAGEKLQRLMIAQDTGGAIKGAVRGDFFWGTGEAALAQAGGMKQKGRYYLFLPKTVAERRAASG